MLLMLAVWGYVSKVRPADAKVRPADAHDASSFGVWCPKYAQLMLRSWLLGVWCPKYAQLMLMMLALWGLVPKVRTADAHDAGSVGVGAQSTPS